MTYLPNLFTRKPLYVALAMATLSFAGLPTPAAAQAAAPAPAPAAAPTPPAQAGDSANAQKDDQTKKTDKDAKTLDAVVVTSFRQSVDQNMQDKRDSNSIVEVINAQNIAQFPAKNIADALAHVPGVVITRESGEGIRRSSTAHRWAPACPSRCHRDRISR